MPDSSPPVTRVILYVRNLPSVAEFYQKFFGMRAHGVPEAGWLELASESGGCTLALHRAALSQKSGAAVKIVFGVADVRAFKERCAREGFEFGPIHSADGFEFANAKDPAGNSISISSRGLA